MAHRIRCKVCNSCLSAIWVENNRYYYCGFCHVYYGGRIGELQVVESPYQNYNVPENVVEDPIMENENEQKPVEES